MMEFRTDHEAALYRLLKQVLENYIVTQGISYHQTLAASLPVLGFQLGAMIDTQEEVPALIARTVMRLHEEQQARTAQPLPSFSDYGLNSDFTRAQELGQALINLLHESAIEHNLSVAATWRVCIALCADVFAMPRLDEAAQPWDIHGFIENLSSDLPEHIDYWFRKFGNA
jgi:hypothetical protein